MDKQYIYTLKVFCTEGCELTGYSCESFLGTTKGKVVESLCTMYSLNLKDFYKNNKGKNLLSFKTKDSRTHYASITKERVESL